MTHSEAIKELNDMLAFLRALLNRKYDDKESMKEQGDCAKEQVKNLLTKVNSQKGAALNMISFYCDANRMNFRDDDHSYLLKTNTCFCEGIHALIDIVQAELNIQKQAIDEEAQQMALKEQKRGNWIQIATLIFSALAASAALYPIIESLMKKIFN